MKEKIRSAWPFLLVTAAAWAVSAVGGLWLLDSTLVQSLPGGFLALGLVGFLAALLISLLQILFLKRANFILWVLATGVGLGAGMAGVVFANAAAGMPVLRETTGLLLVDWLLWLGFLFLLSALVTVPGGLAAGLLRKGSVKTGKTLGWMAVSILNWSVSFGAAPVLVQLVSFPRFFYVGNFRHPSALARGAALGALVGLIQGAVLGRRLVILSRAEAQQKERSMTDEEVHTRLELAQRRRDEWGEKPSQGD